MQLDNNLKSVVADRLKQFDNLNEKTLEELQENFVNTIKQQTAEDHIKFIFLLNKDLDAVFSDDVTDGFLKLSEEEMHTIYDLSESLFRLQDEMREYYYNDELRNQMIDKFGERCLEARIEHSKQAMKMLYRIFNNLGMTNPSKELFV